MYMYIYYILYIYYIAIIRVSVKQNIKMKGGHKRECKMYAYCRQKKEKMMSKGKKNSIPVLTD